MIFFYVFIYKENLYMIKILLFDIITFSLYNMDTFYPKEE